MERLIRTAIILTMFVGFQAMAHAAPNNSSSAGLEEQLKVKKENRDSLKAEVEQLKKVRMAAIENRSKQAELDEKNKQLRQRQAELDQLKNDLERIESDKNQLGKKYQAHINTVRLAFASGEIPELRTKNGKVYQQVEITGFDPQGVKIRHQNGGANLHYSKLPDELQKRLHFDPQKAERFIEEDAKARKQLRDDLARIRKQQQDKVQRMSDVQKNVQEHHNNLLQPKQQDEPKIVDGRISVQVVATRPSNRHFRNKKIRISARAGSEDLRVTVTHGGQGSFNVKARERGDFECWVSSRYCVSAYQGGRLVDEESDRKKTGL